MASFIPSDSSFLTQAVRGGTCPDPTTGAIVAPIVQSTTFAQEALGVDRGYTYSRASNPTVSALEARLGALEKAPPAVCFASGLAAESALFFATLQAGDHVVCGDTVYGGTVRLLRELLAPLAITSTFVNTSEPAEIAGAITPRTKLVFVETPANPTLTLTDIAAVAKLCRERGVRFVVDNTFLTAAIQQPLELGADVSLYSTTKHIEGHNTAVGGAIVSRDQALLDRLRFVRKSVGSIQAPFDAWLTLRGVSTLPVRLKAHSENALTVARALAGGGYDVVYPGLNDFAQRGIAASQHLGLGGAAHGGVLGVRVPGGLEGARQFLGRLTLCVLAESLGAVETLVTHPATMTHADVPRDQRLRIGLTDDYVRVSVGLEDASEIASDLLQALSPHSSASAPFAAPSTTGVSR